MGIPGEGAALHEVEFDEKVPKGLSYVGNELSYERGEIVDECLALRFGQGIAGNPCAKLRVHAACDVQDNIAQDRHNALGLALGKRGAEAPQRGQSARTYRDQPLPGSHIKSPQVYATTYRPSRSKASPALAPV